MKQLLFSCFVLFATVSVKSQCSSAGPRDGNSFSINTSIGTLAWSNTGNAQTSNNSYATAGQALGLFSTVTSQYLVATNFGFTIPTGSTICGIVVEMEKNAGGLGVGSSIKDNSVKLIKGGALLGTSEYADATAWGGGDSYTTYGGASDNWGTVWNYSDINASNFGVAISTKLSTGIVGLFLTAAVDHIRITVHYLTIVPIQLLNFTGKQSGKQIQLDWTTSSELNSQAFIVQRTTGNGSWELIDSIRAAGNSSRELHYSTLDTNPEPVNYYRLKQLDLDGNMQYSKTIRVTSQNSKIRIILYPNPASNFLSIQSTGSLRKLQFFDMNNGEIFPKLSINQLLMKSYDLSSIKSGCYIIRAVTENEILFQKLIVVK